VLSALPQRPDDRVLVDFRTSDDAGVYRWEGGPALVQTVDFFTPIVDDPYTYGEIAAANALSDVYAMGGRPLTALAIAAFPKEGIEREVIRAIFQGGYDKLREAGVALLGGHTVQDPEIKFGYAVTGAIDPARVLTNGGAQPGDLLFLTKPIGTGVTATALKFDRLEATDAAAAVQSMRTLNRAAAEALHLLPPAAIHACTDITGYGLLGHASEMAAASGVTLFIEAAAVPLLPHARRLAGTNRSGGLTTNTEHFGRTVEAAPGVPADLIVLMYDPQTSGGLLVAVAPAFAAAAASALYNAGAGAAAVGRVEPAREGVRLIVEEGRRPDAA
jgi:selenide,water dikinase